MWAGLFLLMIRSCLLVTHDEIGTAITYLSRQGFDHILGYLSGGMLEWSVANMPSETTALISPANLKTQIDHAGDFMLIDVRSEEEYADGAISGATNIPVKEFAFARQSDSKEQTCAALLCCRVTINCSDKRIAALLVIASVSMLNGGTLAWLNNSLPLA